MQRIFLIFFVLSLIGSLATNLLADEVVVFGPKTYERSKGKPNTYTDTFSVPTIGDETTLTLVNGSASGKERRVSSAQVYLNGSEIFGPSDFSQQVGTLEKTINLIQENTLTVELQSKPDSYFTIEIKTQGPPVPGILLPGNADDLAEESIYNYISDDGVPDTEVTYFEGGNVVRTELEIGFVDTATVGEINSLLLSMSARITAMLSGVNQLLVRIPDPESIDQLDTLVNNLEQNDIVRYVLKSRLPETDALPSNFAPIGTPPLTLIDNHLAIHAHAAWNAKNALEYDNSEPPLLIVYDRFGRGFPGLPYFNVNMLNLVDIDPPAPDSEHGYHVLGIIAATWDGPNDASGWATGIYPGQLPLRVIDIQKGLSIGKANKELIDIIQNSHLNVVVNTSLSAPCTPLAQDRACIEKPAKAWLETIRGKLDYEGGQNGTLEDRFIHITAAGNIKPGCMDEVEAQYNSDWSAARLLTDLHTDGGVLLPPLSNTLVIENRKNFIPSNTEPFSAECLDYYSKYPGDLSAIGEEVYSLTDWDGQPKNYSGTSMATPQVAGLAAYIWALNPNLKSQEVLGILQHTSNDDLPQDMDGCSHTQLPQPVIDAYAAILAVDDPRALTGAVYPENAPARLAILDVVGDGGAEGFNLRFDEHDIQRFLDAFAAATTDPDYSRYDLNGDGFTGGSKTSRFDLNADYDSESGLTIDTDITLEIEGTDVHFNEETVSDMAALCYYSYSELYDGNEEERENKLAHLCLPMKLVLGGAPNDDFGFRTYAGSYGCVDPDWDKAFQYNWVCWEHGGSYVHEPPYVNNAYQGPVFTWANDYLIGGVNLNNSTTFSVASNGASGSFTIESSMGDEILFRTSYSASGAPPSTCNILPVYGNICYTDGRVGANTTTGRYSQFAYMNNFTGNEKEVKLKWSFAGNYTYVSPYCSADSGWRANLKLTKYNNLKTGDFSSNITVFDIARSTTMEKGELSGNYTLKISPGHHKFGVYLDIGSEVSAKCWYTASNTIPINNANCNGRIIIEWLE